MKQSNLVIIMYIYDAFAEERRNKVIRNIIITIRPKKRSKNNFSFSLTTKETYDKFI